MKRIAILAAIGIATVVASLPARAQDWAKLKVDASPRHREWATVKYGNRSVQAYVVYPEARQGDNRPVVLIIHEIFGMSDWVEDLADQVAAAGYIAIAPDLLSGAGPNGGGTASMDSGAIGRAINALPPDQITADLNAVADFALKFPSANGKLVVTGYCWGGTQSFRFATNRKDLSAAYVFYGTPPPKEDMARITAPVYGFYAEMDQRVDSTIEQAKADMKAAGKTYEPVVYAGAGHGFMRAGEDPAGTPPNKQAREDAWARWKKLLAEVK